MRENLTMSTDFYQLTMAQGYFFNGRKDDKAVFDLFYRKNPSGNGYSIFAGLEQIIDYIENINFSEANIRYLREQGLREEFLKYLSKFSFTGNIFAFPEGSVVFPYEPLIKIEASIIEAQIIETALLSIVNHQSLIATKASRIVEAAQGDKVLEFGLRRAHGHEAGLYGARAAIVGGCFGTSNVKTGEKFGAAVSGTHAHSWVMSFDSELDAFRAYAKIFPDNCTLLVDTYDTLNSGVPNAIKVFKELEFKYSNCDNFNFAIRLDSGDLAYLSKKARTMLDDAGLSYVKIVASSDLDENLITSLKIQGANIDIWGVGTKLITAFDQPAFGAVYKLAECNGKPKIKVSDNVAKITNPGNKKVIRVYDKKTQKIKADIIALNEEAFDEREELTLYDPRDSWKHMKLQVGEYYLREMHKPIFLKGHCVYEKSKLNAIKEYCQKEKESLWDEYKRLINPHIMKVDLSDQLYDLKQKLLYNKQK